MCSFNYPSNQHNGNRYYLHFEEPWVSDIFGKLLRHALLVSSDLIVIYSRAHDFKSPTIKHDMDPMLQTSQDGGRLVCAFVRVSWRSETGLCRCCGSVQQLEAVRSSTEKLNLWGEAVGDWGTSCFRSEGLTWSPTYQEHHRHFLLWLQLQLRPSGP